MPDDTCDVDLFAIPVEIGKRGGRRWRTIAYLRAVDADDAQQRLFMLGRQQGRFLFEVCGDVVGMSSRHWDLFVEATWPEFKRVLPTQAELTSDEGYGRCYMLPELDERF